MLFFFFYGLDVAIFKLSSIAFIGLVFTGQRWLLQRQWFQRIKKLAELKFELINTNKKTK